MFQSSCSQNWVELEDYCQEILCELDNPYKTRRLGMDCRDPGSQGCVRTHPAAWMPAIHAGMTMICIFMFCRRAQEPGSLRGEG
jgi:hypothetical protein